MNFEQHIRLQQRRTFLGQVGRGMGAVALASLLNPSLSRAAQAVTGGASTPKMPHWSGVVKPLHFPARAKRVIWLTMAGGPSHLETFDNKPKLGEMSGKP